MIYITGDTHGNFVRFSMDAFPEQAEMTKEDIVIICGDFGGVWDYRGESKHEKYWFDWLNDKPFTTCFVDGNHENFTRLNKMPIEHWNGGKIHRVRPSIIHLMRGQIFNLQGKTFFTFGGASSHDIQDGILDKSKFATKKEFDKVRKEYVKLGKMFRINNESWWEQELPSETEMIEGINNLAQVNNRIDYVISHCLPNSINTNIFMGKYKVDRLTQYFQGILDNHLEFQHWFAGHLHFSHKIDPKFSVLYKQIIRVV